MKRAILLTLAAGVATLPALWGVTGNTTFGQSVPAAIPSGASVAPHDDDARTSDATVDNHGRESGDTRTPTAAASSAEDRRGRGSDDATTSSPTRATAESTRAGATSASTVDDKGSGARTTGDDGHSGKGSGKG